MYGIKLLYIMSKMKLDTNMKNIKWRIWNEALRDSPPNIIFAFCL